MLELKNITKTYKMKGSESVHALKNVSVNFPDTGLVFLLGKSGSGKSTMLNVIGGLDAFNSGEIIVKGKSSRTFSERDFDSYRNTYIGFIFQEYNILEEFTVAKNIALALELQGKDASSQAVNDLLATVGLEGFGGRKPNQLSGGQKQRVAIARALIKDPEIIMADEPTGALDSATGTALFETLKGLSASRLIIVVSHDREFAEQYGDRIIEMKDGKILSDVTKRTTAADIISDGVKISGGTVFIAPGHKVTEKEKKIITDKIFADNANGLVLSSDKEINDNFKTFAKMDAQGNREYFDGTKPEDIKRQDCQNFRLIKSRFKYWDSFKMGASGLKVKKLRIIFTILLAVVALTMFGVADTAASFDSVRAMHDSMNANGDTTVAMRMRERYFSQHDDHSWMNDVNMVASDIQYLRNRFPGYTFVGANSLGWETISLNTFANLPGSGWGSYYQHIENAFVMTDAQRQGFNLQFMGAGRMPLTHLEVAITDYQLEIFMTHGLDTWDMVSGRPFPVPDTYRLDVETAADVIGEYLRFEHRGLRHSLEIVGVINTGFNFERYARMREPNFGDNWLADMTLMQELGHVLRYGFSNALFVTANHPIIQPNQRVSSNFALRGSMIGYQGLAAETDEWGPHFHQIHNIAPGTEVQDDSTVVFFDNRTQRQLGNNEVVLHWSDLMRRSHIHDPVMQQSVPNAIGFTNPHSHIWFSTSGPSHNPTSININVQTGATTTETRQRIVMQFRPDPSGWDWHNGVWGHWEPIYTIVAFPGTMPGFELWTDSGGGWLSYNHLEFGWIDWHPTQGGWFNDGTHDFEWSFARSRWERRAYQYETYTATIPVVQTFTATNMTEFRNHITQSVRQIATGNLRTAHIGSHRWTTGGMTLEFNNTATLNVVGVYIPHFAFADFTEWSTHPSDMFSNTIFLPPNIIEQMSLARHFEPSFQTVIASLQGTSADRDLINFLMVYNRDGNVYFQIRNQFSSFFIDIMSMLEGIEVVFFWMGFGFAVFAALMVMNYITMTISYKKRDIGILRAVGARRTDIYKIFFNQSLVITAIQWMVAIITTIIAVIILNNTIGSGLGMPVTLLRFGLRQVLFLAGIALIVAAVASFLPTRKISKLKPIDAIQNRK